MWVSDRWWECAGHSCPQALSLPLPSPATGRPGPLGGAEAVTAAPGPAPNWAAPRQGGRIAELTVPRGQAGMARTPCVSVRPGWVGSYRPRVDSNRIWVRECRGTLALGRFPTPWGPLILPWAAGPWAPTRSTPEAAHSPSRGSGYPTWQYVPLGPPGPHWEHTRPFPQQPPGRHPALPAVTPGGRALPPSPGARWHPFPGAPRHPARQARAVPRRGRGAAVRPAGGGRVGTRAAGRAGGGARLGTAPTPAGL